MAKKQVTVNEELLRGIMAGDVPVYGKNAPKDVIIDEESVEEDIQENGNDTGRHDMKSAVRQKNARMNPVRTAGSSSRVVISS